MHDLPPPLWLSVVQASTEAFDPRQRGILAERARSVLAEVEEQLARTTTERAPLIALANRLAPGDRLTESAFDEPSTLLAWLYRRPSAWLEQGSLATLEATPDPDFEHDFDRCVLSLRPDLQHLRTEAAKSPHPTPNRALDDERVVDWMQIGTYGDGHTFVFWDRSRPAMRILLITNDMPDVVQRDYATAERFLLEYMLVECIDSARAEIDAETD